MSLAKAVVDFVGHDVNLTRTLSGVQGALGGVGAAMGRMATLGGLAFAGLAGAATAALGFVAKEAIEGEANMARLGAALGDVADKAGAMDRLAAFAKEIQRTTNVSDDFVLKLATTAAGLGVAQDQLENTTRAAMALAASTGGTTGAEEALKALTKSALGDREAMNELVPALKGVTDEAERAAIVNAQLARGQAIVAAEAGTAWGELQRFGIILMDIAETAGGALLPSINAATDALAAALPTIERWVGNFVSGAAAIIDAMAPVGTFLMSVFSSIVDTAVSAAAWTVTVWERLGDSVRVVADGVLLGFVAAFEEIRHALTSTVPTLLSWFLENWRDVFQTAANFVATVFENMGANIVNFFDQVTRWLSGEGFDFKWVGLLEGFESTLKELPVIAERHIGPFEASLRDRIAAVGGDLAAQAALRIEEYRRAMGLHSPLAGVVPGGALPAPVAPPAGRGEAADKKTAARGGDFVALDEFWRRISGAGARTPTERANEQTAKNTEEAVEATARVVEEQQGTNKRLDQVVKIMAAGGIPVIPLWGA